VNIDKTDYIYSALVCQPFVKTRVVGNATGQDKVSVSSYIRMNMLSGIKNLNTNNQEYTFTTGSAQQRSPSSDPTIVYQWLIGIQAVSTVTDNLNALVSYEVTHYIEFFNRAPIVA